MTDKISEEEKSKIIQDTRNTLLSIVPTLEEVLPEATDTEKLNIITTYATPGNRKQVARLKERLVRKWKKTCSEEVLRDTIKGCIRNGQVNTENLRKKLVDEIRQNFLSVWEPALKSGQHQKELDTFLKNCEKEYSCKVISSGEIRERLFYITTMPIKKHIKAGKLRTIQFKRITYHLLSDVEKIEVEEKEQIERRRLGYKTKWLSRIQERQNEWESLVKFAQKKIQTETDEWEYDRLKSVIIYEYKYNVEKLSEIEEKFKKANSVKEMQYAIWQFSTTELRKVTGFP